MFHLQFLLLKIFLVYLRLFYSFPLVCPSRVLSLQRTPSKGSSMRRIWVISYFPGSSNGICSSFVVKVVLSLQVLHLSPLPVGLRPFSFFQSDCLWITSSPATILSFFSTCFIRKKAVTLGMLFLNFLHQISIAADSRTFPSIFFMAAC